MELELESILLPGIEEKTSSGYRRSMQRRDRRTSYGYRQGNCLRKE